MLVFAFICASAWASCELFAPRAAYLQVGAMIGTMMVGNVFFVIIPAHWKLVRAKEAGASPTRGGTATARRARCTTTT